MTTAVLFLILAATFAAPHVPKPYAIALAITYAVLAVLINAFGSTK